MRVCYCGLSHAAGPEAVDSARPSSRDLLLLALPSREFDAEEWTW